MPSALFLTFNVGKDFPLSFSLASLSTVDPFKSYFLCTCNSDASLCPLTINTFLQFNTMLCLFRIIVKPWGGRWIRFWSQPGRSRCCPLWDGTWPSTGGEENQDIDNFRPKKQGFRWYLTPLSSPVRYVLKIHFFIEFGLKMIQFKIQFKTKSKIFIKEIIIQ